MIVVRGQAVICEAMFERTETQISMASRCATSFRTATALHEIVHLLNATTRHEVHAPFGAHAEMHQLILCDLLPTQPPVLPMANTLKRSGQRKEMEMGNDQ